MLKGNFKSVDYSDINELRNHLLRADTLLSVGNYNRFEFSSKQLPDFIKLDLMKELEKKGICIIQLDEILSNTDFLKIAPQLGTPIPEFKSDNVLAPYIEEDVILNIISNNKSEKDVSAQPFTKKHLTLHTECSRRAVNEQPRYLVLMCCDTGVYSYSQTVLIPMEKVVQNLSEKNKDILLHTGYQSEFSSPFILREEQDRCICSFRDFFPETLEWVYKGDKSEVDQDMVNEAIKNLLISMYNSSEAIGLPWERGMILIFDNTRFFHGKKAGKEIEFDRPRHLKRLRIKTNNYYYNESI